MIRHSIYHNSRNRQTPPHQAFRRTAKACSVFFTAAFLIAGSVFPAAAGAWQQNEKGYWWQNNDGSYPVSRWVLLDGNRDGTAEYYYFDEDGYLLTDTMTPDYRSVNADGQLLRAHTPVTRAVYRYQSTGGAAAKATLNPELPLDLLGLSTDELQARFGDDLSLADKADDLEYFTIDGLSGYTIVVRRGTVRRLVTTPDNILSDFSDTSSLQRMKSLLSAAGMFVDADSDFMLKAYYDGYEFLFEYHDGGGIDSDNRVTVSFDEP